MAIGYAKGVCGIEFLGHLAIRYMQKTLQHTCHLLLGGMTVASDCHLYLHGRILCYRHVSGESRSYGNTLSVGQLEHCLDVLIDKLSLYRQHRRSVFVEQLGDTEENLLQLLIVRLQLAQVQHSHIKQLDP